MSTDGAVYTFVMRPDPQDQPPLKRYVAYNAPSAEMGDRLPSAIDILEENEVAELQQRMETEACVLLYRRI
mgnify:CR=1 FL=1